MPRQRSSVYILAAVGCVALLTSLSADQPMSSEQPAYVVEKGRSAPIVDGVLDDPAWEGVQEEPLERELDSGLFWGNVGDFEATFKAVWRDGALYVAVRTVDDEQQPDGVNIERLDRLVLVFPGAEYRTYREFVVPIFHTESVEDPTVPFAAWSADGLSVEFSLETDAMYRQGNEMLVNFYFVDVDADGSESRIGWVPFDPMLNEPQLGSLQFERNTDIESLLQTTWGNMKNLY